MASYSNWNIGISASDTAYMYRCVSVDIHSKPGQVQNSLALTDIDTNNLVDSKPTCSIVASNGDTFLGAGTKIFKISSGTISLVHTDTQGAVLGLGEHQGYLYYASATKLGRQTVALASSEASWSSQNDSWATFTNQKAYKPMVWVNQILCIGDGNYIAIVDENGTFLANALDILEQDIITALENTNDSLAIGTFTNSAVHQANLYDWDTYSPSWSESFSVKERGVNMFMEIDGFYYAQIGQIGNIYQWTGSRAVLFKRLRDGDNVVTTDINPYGSTKLNNLTLIATPRGVFSIGKADGRLNLACVIEYVASVGITADLGFIEAVGSNFYLGHKLSTAFGVDTVGTSYATSIIETPLHEGKANILGVKYADMPANCSITARIKVDGGSYADHTLINDSEDSREFRSDANIYNKADCMAEITLVPSGATKPVIKLITIK